MTASAPTFSATVNPREIDGANVILRAGVAGDYHVPAYVTPLSLKTAPRGVLRYTTPRTRYRIEPHTVLVLNAGQTYAMDVDANDRAGTLCFFFQPGAVARVAHAMRYGVCAALEPDVDSAIDFATHERVYAKSEALAAHLDTIERRLARGETCGAWLDDAIMAVAEEIVLLDGRGRREEMSFPGLRASTREEAYRRLHWVRDYIDASFTEVLTIASLAHVACMSAFHFQRLFKQAFGETPMQRVQRARLAHAAHLLATSEIEVTGICAEVGFESLGTFSALFKRRYGAGPRAFRQMRRIEEARRGRRT